MRGSGSGGQCWLARRTACTVLPTLISLALIHSRDFDFRYGTSINYFTAMDPACDVMLAYEQNGEPLRPDHGFPLRLIIPGYIGGRMSTPLQAVSKSTDRAYFTHCVSPAVRPPS